MAFAPPLVQTVETSLGRLRAVLTLLLDEAAARLGPLTARFGGARLIGVFEGDTIVVYTVERKGATALAARLGPGDPAPDRLRGARLEARLPAASFLRRSLSVPKAGRPYLRPIIEHRLERLVPWRPENVLYGFRVVPQAETAADLTVDLLVIARDRAAPFLARLDAAGLMACALGSADESLSAPLAIDLYQGRTQLAPLMRRRLGRAVAASFALLCVSCAATGWLAASTETELQTIEARFAALQARVQARARPATSRSQALLDAQRPETTVGSLLDRLSAALPDRTVLRELDVNHRKVRLLGRSLDAPALVGLLAEQGDLASLRFLAPIVRDGEGRDLFDLTAERRVATGPTE